MHRRADARVIAWIPVNAIAAGLRCDPCPFSLLNLAFSMQAVYAAPLILLAQTRRVRKTRRCSTYWIPHREEVLRHMEERKAKWQRVIHDGSRKPRGA